MQQGLKITGIIEVMTNRILKNRILLFVLVFFWLNANITRVSASSSALSIYDSIAERLKKIGSDTEPLKQKLKDTCRKLSETDFHNIMEKARKRFNELITEKENRQKVNSPTEKNRRALRHFLRMLGEEGFGEENKTLNEHARDLILKVRPDLQGTDLAENPAGTIYYYLALDPGGFVENVRMIRGPMGAPMTLKQAYEYYTATDPEKAARILILLETIQKLSIPTTDESELEIILKSIKTNLELINGE